MRPESFEIKLLSNLHGESLQIIKDYWLQTYTTTGDLKFANTAKIRQVRREIARIKTIIRERELAN